MGNGGFWLFVVIVVANLVITAIKKSAEKKAAAAGKSATAAKPTPPRPVALSGQGSLEVILERIGDRSFDVMTVLREVAGMSLDAASDACVSPPSVVATNLTRSEAGMIRQALEGVGAGVSIRRAQRSSFEVAVSDSAKAAERSIGAIDRTLDRAVRSVGKSVGRIGAVAPSKATRSTGPTGTASSSTRIEALRTPPAASVRVPPSRQATPRIVPVRREIVAPSMEPAALPRPEVANSPVGSRPGSPTTARLVGLIRSRQGLRDAFLLQELLKPPLAERPGSVGGRQG
ncbi:MAG: ribosomal protein L7/L12 [Phycisphaerales bacterium]